MRNNFQLLALSLLFLGGIFSLPSMSWARQENCISAKNQKAIEQNQGTYISSDLLKAILKKRNVFAGQTQWGKNIFQAVFIVPGKGKESIFGTTWHEGEYFLEDGIERCLTPLAGNKLMLHEQGSPQEIYEKIPMPVADYLFTKMLNGCYSDQDGKKLCFKDDNILFENKKKHAALILDSSELEAEGNYLKIDNESLFWVLVPTAQGWNIYQSDWASSDNYTPIDLKKPWKVLTLLE